MKKHSLYKVYLKRRRVVLTDLLTAALKDNKDDLSVPMFSFADLLQDKPMSTTH